MPLTGIDKGRFHIVSRFGRGFQKDEPVFFGKFLAFLGRHGPTMFQIVLVAYQHNDHVRLRMLPCLFQPTTQMLKGISPRNVVDQQGPGRAAVVAAGDGPKGFLSGGIPYLELDEFVTVQGDHAGSKFDTNRQIMDGLETLVGELKEETRLSDACEIISREGG